MAMVLRKSESINLKKEAPGLRRVLVGLGWDPIKRGLFGSSMDIDASVICIDNRGRKDEVVCFHHPNHSSGAIHHCGDNLTGEGDGDDEQIEINLDEIPNDVVRLSVIINIYSAHSKKQDFSQVRKCFVHVDDRDTRRELVRYNVDGEFKGKTGIFVADIYRENDGWKFEAVGEGADVRSIEEMTSIKLRQLR